MEADQELIVLRRTRDELMETALNLRDKLSEIQKSVNVKRQTINMNTSNGIVSRVSADGDMSYTERFPEKLINLTQNVSGISYNNVQKKWLRDHSWIYKARVVMKTLSFDLDLTVDQENNVNEVQDINCHFLERDASLLNEISPWVHTLTVAKNFSSLMSSFSEYNELSVVRRKILSKLVNGGFATVEKCTEDGGGVMVYLHSPKTPSVYYAEYLWKLRLNSKTKSIEHYFVIESTNNDFVAVNQELIEEFCKSGLKKVVLEKLWSSVCSAIDAYK